MEFLQNISSMFIPITTIAGAVHNHSILASESCCHVSLDVDLLRTYDVGLPTQSVSMLGQCRRSLLLQCRQIVYDAGSTVLRHWFCCILNGSILANTCHSPNTIYFYYSPSPEKPLPRLHDTLAQCWCIAELQSVTLGQNYSNHIPLSSNHKYNREYIFFLSTFQIRNYLI